MKNTSNRLPTHVRDKDCLVCGDRLVASRLPGLLTCQACGFTTADMELEDHELEAIYSHDYFHGNEYANYVLEENALRKNLRQRLKTLVALLDAPKEKSLFEIGCAYGFFLDEAGKEFLRVAGIDISQDAIAHARDGFNLDVRTGDFLNLDHDPGDYDVYCMWDTLEHLKHPDRFIAKIAQDIPSGGLLAITTGDISSLNARMRGQHWRLIHPPTHLHYFSRSNLERLLTAHGFETIHVEYPGFSRTFRSIFYQILVLRTGFPRLYKALEMVIPASMKISINLRDIVMIVSRKT